MIAGIVLVVFLMVVGASSASAVDFNPVPVNQRQLSWNEWRWPDIPQEPGLYAQSVYQGIDFLGGVDYIASEPGISVWNPGATTGIVCGADLACISQDGRNLSVTGMLPMCSDSVHGMCVDGLKYSIGSGDFRDANLLFTADAAATPEDLAAHTDPNYPVVSPQPVQSWGEDFIKGMPASATGSLVFDLPGAPNAAGTTTYALTNQFIYVGTTTGKTVNGRVLNFEVNLRPVYVDGSKSGRVMLVQDKINGGYSHFYTGYYGDKDVVAFSNKDSIGFAAGFGTDITVRLSLRLSTTLGGWLQGRAEQPNVTITPMAGDQQNVVLEAKPSVVPITGTEFDVYATQNVRYANYFDPSGYQQFKGNNFKGAVIGRMWSPSDGVDMFNAVSPLLGTKAKGQASLWNFSNLQSTSTCMSASGQLLGLLTTNAMTYQSSLPTYDAGLIDYKVAGLHYDANGQVFKGSYKFIMRDSVARCLYGFKGTGPISGTVSVTSSDGQENVAYTNVNDKDGWLSLTAEGFTFSNPTISAKLTQQPDPAVTPSPTPSPSGSGGSGGSSASYKKTITCVKGKVVKKVSGVSPKCPAGYKKK